MVEKVERSHHAYTTSRWMVIGVAVGSVGLALVLGYALSWSLTGPVARMDAQFQQIAQGDFSQRVAVPNRDEFGTLATNLNRMTAELGQLYQQLEAASRHKSQFLATSARAAHAPQRHPGLYGADPGRHLRRRPCAYSRGPGAGAAEWSAPPGPDQRCARSLQD